MPVSVDQITQATCQLSVGTTLPLVCISSLLSFLCGVGIGANDLSANFAMVVGSGSLDMKRSILYCIIFELLGAAFMGGKVSNTIRNGIIQPAVFTRNRDEVIMGMTCASFSAGLWLYLSTVFGLPVSITHTVIGSIIGFAVYSTGGFGVIEVPGLTVVVLSWIVAPVAAFVVTAAIFYVIRRFILLRTGQSFDLTVTVLPYLLGLSMLCGLMFIIIEQPLILERTLAYWVPVLWQFATLLLLTAAMCVCYVIIFLPRLVDTALTTSHFVWESAALRTEVGAPTTTTTTNLPLLADKEEDATHTSSSFYDAPHTAATPHTRRSSHRRERPHADPDTDTAKELATPAAVAPSDSLHPQANTPLLLRRQSRRDIAQR